MKLGIFGGTFDPLHLGHIHIARAAFFEYALDEIWFMPALSPYFKEGDPVTPAPLRFRMTEESLKEYPLPFSASDFEINLGKEKTYTSETLLKLKEMRPGDELFFICGLDSLKSLPTWHEPEKIFGSAAILVAPRDLDDAEKEVSRLREIFRGYETDIRIIRTDILPISSTMIREMERRGEDISSFVLPETYDFIRRYGLYRSRHPSA